MSQSISLFDESKSSGDFGSLSISNGGSMTNCKRCKSAMPESYIFCALCGYSTKTKSKRTTETTVVPSRSITSKLTAINDTNTIGRRRKKSHLVNPVESQTTKLSLPRQIIDGIEQLLAAPALDSKALTKRTIQEFKTQLLEIRNAEDIEIAVLNKHNASVGLDSQINQSVIDAIASSPPTTLIQNAGDSKPMSKQRTKKSSQPPLQLGYLNEVESISNHYTRYLQRLKQLEGLRAALMEAPTLPSEQLKDIRKTPQLSERHEGRGLPATNSGGALDLGLAHADLETGPPAAMGTNEVGDGNACSEEAADVSSAGSGMAFMWGPVFNTSASIADTSLYSSITAPPGVQYLDFQTEVGDEAPGSKTSSKPSSPKSRHSSRSASPVAFSIQAESATPTKTASQSHEVDPQGPAPVVMFWGNIMSNDADLLDDGTPSAHLSRASSYRSIRTDSSAAEAEEEQNLAAEEAELPAWIEALAAETAGIRDEFQEEDHMIMDALGTRLQQMDAANITMQSRRALLVQYSMDGVVTEYREKIKQMKATMGLKPSRPGTATVGDGDAAGDVLMLGSSDAVLGVHEEKRAMEEAEDSRPIEAPQIVTRRVSVDGQLQQRRLSNKGILQSTGEVLLKFEKLEQDEAVERDQKQTEDELKMQELILSLTQAHLQATGSKVAAGAPKSALQGDVLAHSAAEHRIGALLEQAERLEERDKHARESHESADELALQQWLVAVTAFDADRARKQTLRTLQLEELEDRMGDDSDEEEEEGGAATSTNASSKAPAFTAAELAGATIEVPENNSLAVIKTLYRQSCSKMLASLPELAVDFTIDQTEQPDFRMEARSKLQFARRILKASSNVDHKVAVEYRKFLDFCAVRRAALALELSEAMQKASQLEKSYRDRYAEATREYKSSADALLADTSDNVKHVTTSKHMQAIKLSAELDINQQGAVVRTLQANEAKLLLDTRQEQYVLSEVLGIWQARHSKVLHRYSLAFKRLSGLLEAK